MVEKYNVLIFQQLPNHERALFTADVHLILFLHASTKKNWFFTRFFTLNTV